MDAVTVERLSTPDGSIFRIEVRDAGQLRYKTVLPRELAVRKLAEFGVDEEEIAQMMASAG